MSTFAAALLGGLVAAVAAPLFYMVLELALRRVKARMQRHAPADAPLMPGAHFPRQDRPNHGAYVGMARLSCTNCGEVTLQTIYTREGFYVGLCGVCGVPTRRPDHEGMVLM